MKTSRIPAAGAAALILGALCAAPASANCYGKSASRAGRTASLFSMKAKSPAMPATGSAPARLAPRATTRDASNATAPAADPSIVGYWYMQYRVDGQLIADGFDVWLSDGIEILNDSSAPSQGAVCMGIWTKTGPFSYTLKHPSWIFDDAGVTLIGLFVISETDTVSVDGNHVTGKGTTDLYDLTGNLLDHGEYTVSGDRVSANDQPTAGGIPGLPLSILNR